jgi:acetate---CoA ligase (ADP-forming)
MTPEHFLDVFFKPKSVAVIGATRNPGALHYHVFANLVKLGYPGKLYPVNPGAAEIAGIKAYPNIKAIPDDIDLVVICIPAAAVPAAVQECVEKKIKAISIISGGFSEGGSEGRKVQDRMLKMLRANGIHALGPNALSPVNSRLNFIIGFGPCDPIPQGGLSFIFQSGLYQPRFNWLMHTYRMYISKLIDLGNKMDITEVDALDYLAQDAETSVIAMHCESIAGDGRRFMQALSKATARKPVIVLKSGRTPAGAKAASSHTGAIIKSGDHVIEAVLRQCGAIRAQGLDDFFDLAKAFEYLPAPKSNRVAISTLSGGEGVLATDFCYNYGLELALLTPETRQKLKPLFPSWELNVNPFDTGVSMQFYPMDEIYPVLLNALINDPNVDSLLMHLGGVQPSDPVKQAKLIGDLKRHGKPMLAWDVDPVRNKDFAEQLNLQKVPVFESAERAVRALGTVYRHSLRK